MIKFVLCLWVAALLLLLCSTSPVRQACSQHRPEGTRRWTYSPPEPAFNGTIHFCDAGACR